jgi:leader peptidase (prepilin peptidase)/N-methyltransferase
MQRVYRRLRGGEGMGTGDVKLMLVLGSLTGWQGLPLTILAGSASALLASLVYLRLPQAEGMKTAVPFGPFLALGAILYFLAGQEIMDWYMRV